MPTIDKMVVDGEEIWEAAGLGIVVRHRQLWQVQLLWHCKCIAMGMCPLGPPQ